MSGTPVRLSTSSKWPANIQAVIDAFKVTSAAHIEFSINMIPTSVNNQYIKGRNGRQYGHHPDVIAMRDLVALTLGRNKVKLRGIVSAVIVVESPTWTTKAGTVRESDIDNRAKTILDAVQKAVPTFRDQNVWEVHLFKLAAKHVRTSVYLFDIGDVIPFYSGEAK